MIVAAGDIACPPDSPVTTATCNQAATAKLIGTLDADYVLPLGDLVYPAGTQPAFAQSYDPTWGAYKAITRPVPGNHEFGTRGASGYFLYFGRQATPREPKCVIGCEGYYSYSAGAWHVVALNVNCDESTGICDDLSAQAAWLAEDLAAHPKQCTLAYLHNPLFSATAGATPGVKPLWTVLQNHGVELVLSAHAHNYQRFAPQDANGQATPTGITQIIAGTGGHSLHSAGTTTNQVARVNEKFGVARLDLRKNGWTSTFVSTDGSVFDSSAGSCH